LACFTNGVAFGVVNGVGIAGIAWLPVVVVGLDGCMCGGTWAGDPKGGRLLGLVVPCVTALQSC